MTIKQFKEKEGEIILTNDNLARLGITELKALAGKLNLEYPKNANRGSLIKMLIKDQIKIEKSKLEQNWIDLLEDVNSDPDNNDSKTIVVKKTVVVGKKVTLGKNGLTINLAPDERILSQKEYPDRWVYVVQGKRLMEKRTVLK
ncbi:MAG TPA: hypothetical protein VMV56_07650 [Williamwhitmania sp.]|nr:hypothetical protein [Williamwhitmania sp.]